MHPLTHPPARSAGRPRILVLLLGLLGVLAGCGSSATPGSAVTTSTTGGTGTTASQAAQFPVTITNGKATVTIKAQPAAIVSLSPTATEMLFAIGAGPQVTAVDSLSNYPAEAPKTDLSAFQPNLEAIAARKPDLVVLSNADAKIQDGLAALGVPVLLEPAATRLDDTYAQMAELGQATGHPDRAATVVADMKTRVSQILAQAPPPGATPVRVYHELDTTYYSASSGSFIGALYKLLGFDNVADAADPDGSVGYPQLQPEQIIKADPTMIVITTAGGYTPADVAARPGWNVISAVKSGNIVQIDDDIASRWGPRVVDFLQQLVAATAKVKAGQ